MGRAVVCSALAVAGAAAADVAFAPSPVAAAIQTGNCTPDPSWPADNASLAAQVMSLINQHRAGIGEGPLATSPTLTASAVWKAEHMAEFDYFSHDDPQTAETPARGWDDRLQTCGYPYGAGENIAEGFPDAQSVVDAWLNSPGHKANIENPSYVATGLGVAEDSSGEIYWVQDFGQVADSGSPPPPPPPTTTTPPPPTTTTAPPTTTRSTTTTSTPPTGSSGGSGAATTTTTAQSNAPAAGSGPAPTARLLLTGTTARVSKHRFVLTTKVSSTASTPSRAAVKCVASVGSRSLRVVVNAYRNNVAHCSWRLPAHLARDAVAHGWIAVHSGTRHVRETFSLVLGVQ